MVVDGGHRKGKIVGGRKISFFLWLQDIDFGDNWKSFKMSFELLE